MVERGYDGRKDLKELRSGTNSSGKRRCGTRYETYGMSPYQDLDSRRKAGDNGAVGGDVLDKITGISELHHGVIVTGSLAAVTKAEQVRRPRPGGKVLGLGG